MRTCDICGNQTPANDTGVIDVYDYETAVGMDDVDGSDEMELDMCRPCNVLYKDVLRERLATAIRFDEIKPEVNKRLKAAVAERPVKTSP